MWFIPKDCLLVRIMLSVVILIAIETPSAASLSPDSHSLLSPFASVMAFEQEALMLVTVSGSKPLIGHEKPKVCRQIPLLVRPQNSFLGRFSDCVTELKRAGDAPRRIFIVDEIKNLVTGGAADAETLVVLEILRIVERFRLDPRDPVPTRLRSAEFLQRLQLKFARSVEARAHRENYVRSHGVVLDIPTLKKLIFDGWDDVLYEKLWRPRRPSDDPYIEQTYDAMRDAVIMAIHIALQQRLGEFDAHNAGIDAGRQAHRHGNEFAYDLDVVPSMNANSNPIGDLVAAVKTQGEKPYAAILLLLEEALRIGVHNVKELHQMADAVLPLNWPSARPAVNAQNVWTIHELVRKAIPADSFSDPIVQGIYGKLLDCSNPRGVLATLRDLEAAKTAVPGQIVHQWMVHVLAKDWKDLAIQSEIHSAVLSLMRERSWDPQEANVWRILVSPPRVAPIKTAMIMEAAKAMGEKRDIPDEFVVLAVPLFMSIRLETSDVNQNSDFKQSQFDVLRGIISQRPRLEVVKGCLAAAGKNADIVQAEMEAVRNSLRALARQARHFSANSDWIMSTDLAGDTWELVLREGKGVVRIRSNAAGWEMTASDASGVPLMISWFAFQGVMHIEGSRSSYAIPAPWGAFGMLALDNSQHGFLKKVNMGLAPWLTNESSDKKIQNSGGMLNQSLLGWRLSSMPSLVQAIVSGLRRQLPARVFDQAAHTNELAEESDSEDRWSTAVAVAKRVLSLVPRKNSDRGGPEWGMRQFDEGLRLLRLEMPLIWRLPLPNLVAILCLMAHDILGQEDPYAESDMKTYVAWTQLHSFLVSRFQSNSTPRPDMDGSVVLNDAVEGDLRLVLAYVAIAGAMEAVNVHEMMSFLENFNITITKNIEDSTLSADTLIRILDFLESESEYLRYATEDSSPLLLVKIAALLWERQKPLNQFVNINAWKVWLDNLFQDEGRSLIILLDRRQDFAFAQLFVKLLLERGLKVTLIAASRPLLHQPTESWFLQVLKECPWAQPFLESERLRVLSRGNPVPGLDWALCTDDFILNVYRQSAVLVFGKHAVQVVHTENFSMPVLGFEFWKSGVVFAANPYNQVCYTKTTLPSAA